MSKSINLRMISIVSNIEHVREIPISAREYFDGRRKMAAGALIQDVFPQLSNDDREFILSGITPEEWEQVMADSEIAAERLGL